MVLRNGTEFMARMFPQREKWPDTRAVSETPVGEADPYAANCTTQGNDWERNMGVTRH